MEDLQQTRDKRAEFETFPRVLPSHWLPTGPLSAGRTWRRADGLVVIASVNVQRDSRRWLHVSCSHATKLPTWDDLKEVKRLFVGAERPALQVLPRESEYVNAHPYVLHLWSCLDEPDIVPNFAVEGLI